MSVIVTGSSTGIGKAIAELYLENGYGVWGVDILPSSIVHERYVHVTGDIRTVERELFPDPSVLINCAGTLDEELSIDVNLKGTIRFTDLFINSEELRSVLFIASASARNGAEFPNYCASKAGIVAYMKNLALKLSKRGILCNSISPGGVVTPANRHILESEELYAAVRNETLLGKWAEAGEIADLAWYLCSVNRSVTGEDILIDNGEMLKSNFIW